MSSTRKHYKYEYLTSRWGGMQLREEMDSRIEKWISGFSEEEQQIMLELLANFYYYSEKRVNEKVLELYQKFSQTFTGDFSDVSYIKIIKEQGASFSDIFYTAFWFKNNLYDYTEPNILSLLESDIVPPILVIVDDYSGTGKTFIKSVDKMIEKNNRIVQSTFYFLTLHITQQAIKQIEAYSLIVGIQIKIVALDVSDETFKNGYLFEEIKAIELKKQYSDICISRSIKNEFILGYEDVASLVAFHYNTPNNTLGLFWNDLAEFAALFPRHKKEQTTLKKLQIESKARKKRQTQVIAYGIDDARMAAIMTYCIAYSKNLSLENIKNAFGLTGEQLDFVLRTLIEQEYIFINEDGNILTPTEKFKSHMFVSRLKKYKKSFQESEFTEESPFNIHDEYIPVNFNKRRK